MPLFRDGMGDFCRRSLQSPCSVKWEEEPVLLVPCCSHNSKVRCLLFPWFPLPVLAHNTACSCPLVHASDPSKDKAMKQGTIERQQHKGQSRTKLLVHITASFSFSCTPATKSPQHVFEDIFVLSQGFSRLFVPRAVASPKVPGNRLLPRFSSWIHQFPPKLEPPL